MRGARPAPAFLVLAAALAVAAVDYMPRAEAAEPSCAVIVFEVAGRKWVYLHAESPGATGQVRLTAASTDWARFAVSFNNRGKVRLTTRDAINIRECVGFATREEARAYHWRLEQQGYEPWTDSCRPVSDTQTRPPTSTTSPGPTPRTDPGTFNPWAQPQPDPQPRTQPSPRPLQGRLSHLPASPAAREAIRFRLDVYDPNDAGWPSWQTAWYVGNQLVGGTGSGAIEASFGIVNPGLYTVSVQVRNSRTGVAGTFSTTVQVRDTGSVPGPGPATPPPLFQPLVPNWEPFNPEGPYVPDSSSRRRTGGRVPGLGGFGRLPGARSVFEALVGLLGPGAMALILHILSTLFGSGGGGSTAPLAVKIPEGPGDDGGPDESQEDDSADDGPRAGAGDRQPPPEEEPKPPAEVPKALPVEPARAPDATPASEPPARPGRPEWTDAERARIMAMLQNMQQAARREGRDVSLLGEFLGAVKDDFATVPEWVLGVMGKAAGELGNAGNWRIAGETAAGTADDLFVHSDEGARKVGRAALDAGRLLLELGKRAGSALWNDPLDAIKQGGRGALNLAKAMLGADNWSKVVDGEVPLGERLTRALYGAVDSGLTLWGAGSKVSEWLGRSGAAEWRGVLRAPELADAADAAGDAARAADAADDALDAARAADVADDAADAARAAGHADGLTDAERAAGRLEQAGDHARRQAAWDDAVRGATDKVDEFESALLGGDRDRVRKAMIDIQNDKLALQEINARGNNLKRLYKEGWQEVYDKTDDLVRAEIARRYGVDPSQVRLVTPTNPPPPGAAVKVGADRDVTYRIFKEIEGKPVSFDVEHRYGQEVYDQAFHQAAEGARHCPGASPREFTGGCDQLVTSAQHADAYGNSPAELEKILSRPNAPLADPTQIGQVMAYKSQEVYQQVDELRDRIAALRRTSGGGAGAAAEIARLESQSERMLFEGIRQNTKQWNNQVLRRVAALGEQGLDVRIPERLQEAVGVLSRVKPGSISPSQAAAELAAMGTTPDRVAYETGKLLESLEKLRPQPAGAWSRLTNALAGLLGGGS